MSLQKLHKTTGTSPASASTAVLDTIQGTDKYRRFKAVAELVGATGGVLDVYIQWSPDKGGTWYDYAHFTQLAASASAVKYSFGSDFGGTGITTVGSGLTPALAAGTCIGGTFGSALRVLCVAGSSTSAGAAITINFEFQDTGD